MSMIYMITQMKRKLKETMDSLNGHAESSLSSDNSENNTIIDIVNGIPRISNNNSLSINKINGDMAYLEIEAQQELNDMGSHTKPVITENIMNTLISEQIIRNEEIEFLRNELQRKNTRILHACG